MNFQRYAIYYLPPPGPLAEFGARWLGWDVGAGAPARQPALDGIQEITATPRKYGFHGTLKPPFRLADGTGGQDLVIATRALARRCAPARAEGLALTPLGRFFALTARGDGEEIARVAALCVTELDRFRAPSSEADLARRRAAGLSERQDALLLRWGYPYVLDQFRFHLTLTGRLPKAEAPGWAARIEAHLPDLPVPFVLDEIAIVGERADGCFECVERVPLTGDAP